MLGPFGLICKSWKLSARGRGGNGIREVGVVGCQSRHTPSLWVCDEYSEDRSRYRTCLNSHHLQVERKALHPGFFIRATQIKQASSVQREEPSRTIIVCPSQSHAGLC